jgi:hypothetical protein
MLETGPNGIASRVPVGHAWRSWGCGRSRVLRWLVILLTVASFAAPVQADTQQERRVRTGARLMLALLAADVELEAKTRSTGRIEVLIYGRDAQLRSVVSQTLSPVQGEAPVVRGLPLAVAHLDREPAPSLRPQALFVANPLERAELDRLIAWSIRQGVILYSPFEGDVERGALAGLSIEAKVLPLLNRRTLEASGIRLKPFFLKIAKVVP